MTFFLVIDDDKKWSKSMQTMAHLTSDLLHINIHGIISIGAYEQREKFIKTITWTSIYVRVNQSRLNKNVIMEMVPKKKKKPFLVQDSF